MEIRHVEAERIVNQNLGDDGVLYFQIKWKDNWLSLQQVLAIGAKHLVNKFHADLGLGLQPSTRSKETAPTFLPVDCHVTQTSQSPAQQPSPPTTVVSLPPPTPAVAVPACVETPETPPPTTLKTLVTPQLVTQPTSTTLTSTTGTTTPATTSSIASLCPQGTTVSAVQIVTSATTTAIVSHPSTTTTISVAGAIVTTTTVATTVTNSAVSVVSQTSTALPDTVVTTLTTTSSTPIDSTTTTALLSAPTAVTTTEAVPTSLVKPASVSVSTPASTTEVAVTTMSEDDNTRKGTASLPHELIGKDGETTGQPSDQERNPPKTLDERKSSTDEENLLLSQIQEEKHSKGRRGRKRKQKLKKPSKVLSPSGSNPDIGSVSSQTEVPTTLSSAASSVTSNINAVTSVSSSHTAPLSSIQTTNKDNPSSSRTTPSKTPNPNSDKPTPDTDRSSRKLQMKPGRKSPSMARHQRKMANSTRGRKRHREPLTCCSPSKLTTSLITSGRRASKATAALKIQHIKQELTGGDSPLPEYERRSLCEIKQEIAMNNETPDPQRCSNTPNEEDRPSCSKFQSKSEKRLKQKEMHNDRRLKKQNRKEDALFLHDEHRLRIQNIKQEKMSSDSVTATPVRREAVTVRNIKQELRENDTVRNDVRPTLPNPVKTKPPIAGAAFPVSTTTVGHRPVPPPFPNMHCVWCNISFNHMKKYHFHKQTCKNSGVKLKPSSSEDGSETSVTDACRDAFEITPSALKGIPGGQNEKAPSALRGSDTYSRDDSLLGPILSKIDDMSSKSLPLRRDIDGQPDRSNRVGGSLSGLRDDLDTPEGEIYNDVMLSSVNQTMAADNISIDENLPPQRLANTSVTSHTTTAPSANKTTLNNKLVDEARNEDYFSRELGEENLAMDEFIKDLNEGGEESIDVGDASPASTVCYEEDVEELDEEIRKLLEKEQGDISGHDGQRDSPYFSVVESKKREHSANPIWDHSNRLLLASHRKRKQHSGKHKRHKKRTKIKKDVEHDTKAKDNFPTTNLTTAWQTSDNENILDNHDVMQSCDDGVSKSFHMDGNRGREEKADMVRHLKGSVYVPSPAPTIGYGDSDIEEEEENEDDIGENKVGDDPEECNDQDDQIDANENSKEGNKQLTEGLGNNTNRQDDNNSSSRCNNNNNSGNSSKGSNSNNNSNDTNSSNTNTNSKSSNGSTSSNDRSSNSNKSNIESKNSSNNDNSVSNNIPGEEEEDSDEEDEDEEEDDQENCDVVEKTYTDEDNDSRNGYDRGSKTSTSNLQSNNISNNSNSRDKSGGKAKQYDNTSSGNSRKKEQPTDSTACEGTHANRINGERTSSSENEPDDANGHPDESNGAKEVRDIEENDLMDQKKSGKKSKLHSTGKKVTNDHGYTSDSTNNETCKGKTTSRNSDKKELDEAEHSSDCDDALKSPSHREQLPPSEEFPPDDDNADGRCSEDQEKVCPSDGPFTNVMQKRCRYAMDRSPKQGDSNGWNNFSPPRIDVTNDDDNDSERNDNDDDTFNGDCLSSSALSPQFPVLPPRSSRRGYVFNETEEYISRMISFIDKKCDRNSSISSGKSSDRDSGDKDGDHSHSKSKSGKCQKCDSDFGCGCPNKKRNGQFDDASSSDGSTKGTRGRQTNNSYSTISFDNIVACKRKSTNRGQFSDIYCSDQELSDTCDMHSTEKNHKGVGRPPKKKQLRFKTFNGGRNDSLVATAFSKIITYSVPDKANIEGSYDNFVVDLPIGGRSGESSASDIRKYEKQILHAFNRSHPCKVRALFNMAEIICIAHHRSTPGK